ncbi:hypothetical protein I551_8410 [Mycobacterium ulcerans str. Harvey]|uniref:Uncharacterized protein n=1 Tax=Mycobacterium ulcerans str. Harvey TaxID=1299332 RepID=A0ABN0QKP5_MYCUL|nr:hypothetical protein I551_8410 [Mycobacterium ulcerans str. Harvey]
MQPANMTHLEDKFWAFKRRSSRSRWVADCRFGDAAAVAGGNGVRGRGEGRSAGPADST